MATGPVKNFISFSEDELSLFGGHSGLVPFITRRKNHETPFCVVVPMKASAKCDFTEFFSRGDMLTGCLASSYTGCWERVDDKQPAWLLATAQADGAPFAELRVDFVQTVKLPDLLSGKKLSGTNYAATGDIWAAFCGYSSAAELVASIKKEYRVNNKTKLAILGFKVRPDGAPFNRVTQDDVDEQSELEGDC
jgi:hypothetical protein